MHNAKTAGRSAPAGEKVKSVVYVSGPPWRGLLLTNTSTEGLTFRVKRRRGVRACLRARVWPRLNLCKQAQISCGGQLVDHVVERTVCLLHHSLPGSVITGASSSDEKLKSCRRSVVRSVQPYKILIPDDPPDCPAVICALLERPKVHTFLDAGDLGRLSQTSKHMLSLCFDEVGLTSMVDARASVHSLGLFIYLFVCVSVGLFACLPICLPCCF